MFLKTLESKGQSQLSKKGFKNFRHKTQNYLWLSYNIESLFTNIPLEEIFDLFVKNLTKDRTHDDNFSKHSFRALITMTMFESLILFHQEFNNSVSSMMQLHLVSPLRPALANVFLCIMKKMSSKLSIYKYTFVKMFEYIFLFYKSFLTLFRMGEL